MEKKLPLYGTVRSVNMRLTFDRRYDEKWEFHRQMRERCDNCMFDAPGGEECCKHHCGEYSICADCQAKCRETAKLCVK